MSAATITDHVWRPIYLDGGKARRVTRAARLCAYLSCKRPRAEHERSTTLRAISW